MIKLNAIMRSGFFTKTEDERRERIFQETKATLHPALLFVGCHQCVIGEDGGIEHIGAHNETGLA